MWRFINIQIRERESREKAEHFEWKPTKKSAERNDIAKVYHPAAKWQTHAYSHEKKKYSVSPFPLCVFFYSSFYFRDFYFEPHILWIRWRCEFADLTQSHSHLTRRQGWIVKDRFVFFSLNMNYYSQIAIAYSRGFLWRWLFFRFSLSFCAPKNSKQTE